MEKKRRGRRGERIPALFIALLGKQAYSAWRTHRDMHQSATPAAIVPSEPQVDPQTVFRKLE